jgi:hypothetical protein
MEIWVVQWVVLVVLALEVVLLVAPGDQVEVMEEVMAAQVIADPVQVLMAADRVMEGAAGT